MNGIVLNYRNDLVQVKTDIGVFEGIWKSDKLAEYRCYDLELACDDVIEQEVLQYSGIATPFITNVENGVMINALLEEIEDSVLFLRLFGDLMMLEISPSSDFSIYVGCYVRVKLSHIHLYAI